MQASDHATVDLRVKPETQRAMTVLGFRTHARLELAPGRYQIRAGGIFTGTELVGSVHTEIEVPDFSARGLQISGLELTCVVAAYTPTAHADERMHSVLPAPPTTMRDVRNDDTLALFAAIYDAGADSKKNLAAPRVTFANTMIVAVFLGERPTAGYLPEIAGVRLEGDTLVVEWRERTPSHAGNPPTVTTPFAVAGVPMHAGAVRFEKRVTR